MIAAWMLYTLLVSALVALAARAAEALFRARGLPARAAWSAALALMLSLPVLTAFRAPSSEAPLPLAANAPPGTLQTAPLPKVPAAFPARPSLDRPLLVGWGLASLALLGFLLHGTGVLHGRRREWRDAEVDGRRLLVSPDVGPAVVGWRRMQIVVPAWVLGLDRESREIVLAHEEEHIRRHDPRLLLATLMAAALMPWNLALWYAARRLRLAVELDCDARVVARGVDRYRYGRVLLEAGSRTRAAGLPALATFAERPTQLESRLSALAPAPAAGRTPRAFGAGGVAALLLIAACSMDNPMGIDLADRVLASKVRLAQEVSVADDPAVVRMLVRRFAEDRTRRTLEAGGTPAPFVAIVVLDPQRRIMRIGAGGSSGGLEPEISLADLGGAEIESVEVVKGRSIDIENVEGLILIQMRDGGEAVVKAKELPQRRPFVAPTDATEKTAPSVLVRRRNP